ncbi:MAG: hypothetical protein ACRDU8_02230 [Egibacteraceae bacterium]
MSTATTTSRISRVDVSRRAGPAFFMAGGVTFIAGGALHPSDSGVGNKVVQLHDMLIHRMWYPSHLLLLMAMACFAAGIVALRRRPDLRPPLTKLVNVASVVACVAAVGMLVHLFAALGAESLANGEHSLFSRVQTVNETIVDASWGLAIAVLAVTGGWSRTVGNRFTIPLGLVGGLAFSLASATIAFTDQFDALFALGSLVGIWAVAVGAMGLRRTV